MAVEWTIKIGSAAAVPLADLGLSNLTRTCRSMLVDVVSFRHDGAGIDATPLMAYGAAVIVYRDGVQWFVGRNQTVPVYGDGSGEGHVFTIHGPWQWLEDIVYTQDWKVWDIDDGALVTKRKSRCILCQDASGDPLDSGEQIADALQVAMDLGAPIQIGTIDPAVAVPLEECVDVLCAEVVRKIGLAPTIEPRLKAGTVYWIDIDLRNGDTISLSPASEANHYRDQKGNKVVRTVDGQDHIYKWPNRKITVRFGGNSANNSSGGVGDLQDMVNGRWVGAEVEEELGRRGYKSVREEAAGGYVTNVYKGHGKCVIVNLDKDKRVTSVDEGSGCRFPPGAGSCFGT
jgi:hypothetical protein